MDWQTFIQTFFDLDAMARVLPDLVFIGIKNTLIIAGSAFVIGSLLGVVLALMAISSKRLLRWPSRAYTDIFRGLPAILTILIIGTGFGRLSRGIFGPSPYPLGILALSLIGAAYAGEIFRSGIQSVERGQLDACRALGMPYVTAMRLVVIPQGIKRVLPAMMNHFIGMVKDSSLVFFLGLLLAERETFRVAQDAAATTGNLSPLVLAAMAYLIITVPLTHLVNYFDVRFRTGTRKQVAPTSGLLEVEALTPAPVVATGPDE